MDQLIGQLPDRNLDLLAETMSKDDMFALKHLLFQMMPPKPHIKQLYKHIAYFEKVSKRKNAKYANDSLYILGWLYRMTPPGEASLGRAVTR